MAGSGTYISFDKERVGVYTKFEAKKASDFINADTTGIVSIGLPMDWGKDGEITEVLGTEIENGACLSKIGYSLNDEEILPYRLALHNAYKAYFYKLNKGGNKATANVGNIVIVAKYTGICGNSIKVVITANTPSTGRYMVDVYYKGSKRETFYVSNGEELIALTSEWVDFTSEAETPTITSTTGVTLEGGTNGSVVKDTTGGTKATVDIGSLTFTAKNEGTDGNKIGITIAENSEDSSKYDLAINVNNVAEESFLALEDIAAFLAVTSNLVTITNPSGSTITTATNTLLTGGTDAATSSYEDFFKAIRYKLYDYIAVNSADATISDKIVEFVNKEIARGKYVSGVVYNKPLLNNKYIVSVDQGLECEGFTITTALMPMFVASMRAGCPLGKCLDDHDMYEEIGATKIINEVEDDDAAVTAKLNQGCFFYTYLNDGTVVVEEDINTFVEYSQNDPADYRRNRLIATQNYIGNHVYLFQNKQVLAKSMADDDSQVTRGLLKSDIDTVCSELAEKNVIRNYNPVTDIAIDNVEGRKSELITKTNLFYLDSLRKIYNEFTIVLEA